MAEALDQVYDTLLLDHIRSARNYGLDEAGPPAVELANPLCGDVLQLQVAVRGDHLATVRFSCECCGIAMGNASLMTEVLQGVTAPVARVLAHQALAALRAPEQAAPAGETGAIRPQVAQAWALLQAVARSLPARRTCASMGWQALLAVLDGRTDGTAEDIRA